MVVVAIDRKKGMRKVFTCPHELAAEVDAWRREQPSIPSESAVFAELIREALKRWREEQKRGKGKAVMTLPMWHFCGMELAALLETPCNSLAPHEARFATCQPGIAT